MSPLLRPTSVWFVDTSIVTNILRVPGRDQQSAKAALELGEKIKAKDTLILPVTAVVETGNHIAQIADGRSRRETARRFSELLTLIVSDQAPWKLHVLGWDQAFLELLINAPTPGHSLVDLAVSGVGGGDACILAEREIYRRRTGLPNVHIWSLDAGLLAFD